MQAQTLLVYVIGCTQCRRYNQRGVYLFFLVNAQLLLGDITVGLCEHFLVRICVRISVRKYQKILINSY